VLGVFPEWNNSDRQVAFQPGDRLLLFTDGATELLNSKGEEFGDDRLIAIVQSSIDASALHDAVVKALDAFASGAIQDDVTIVGVTAVEP
jgi:serine phosphatase RsbU (regulator of sigma subunit)